jgi:hypothetical protein
LRDFDVEGRMGPDMKTVLEEMGCDDVDCINLVQNMDQWRALVRPVMNLRVPK